MNHDKRKKRTKRDTRAGCDSRAVGGRNSQPVTDESLSQQFNLTHPPPGVRPAPGISQDSRSTDHRTDRETRLGSVVVRSLPAAQIKFSRRRRGCVSVVIYAATSAICNTTTRLQAQEDRQKVKL